MRFALVVALVGGLALGPLGSSRASAAETQEEEVERLANEALHAYKGADYKRAVELLQKAYELRQVPALLYNLAKAYDKLGDLDRAYDAYRQYADSAAADPKLKTRAEARLAALGDARRKKAAAARAESQPPVEPPPPGQVEPPKPAAPSAEEQQARVHDDYLRDRRRARLFTIIAGGATVAFAAVAIGLASDALVVQGQFHKATLPADKSSLKSDAVVRAGVADGFFALTAAGAAVTGYFAWRAFLRKEPSAPAVALLPMVTPAGGGLVALGRF